MTFDPRERALDDLFEALALGVKSYYEKTGAFQSLGIALSGGRDSMLTLLVAWRAAQMIGAAHPARVDGPYGAEGYVVQALSQLPAFEGNYPVLGSWIVAGQACGLGIREDVKPITSNTSRFVPHIIHG